MKEDAFIEDVDYYNKRIESIDGIRGLLSIVLNGDEHQYVYSSGTNSTSMLMLLHVTRQVEKALKEKCMAYYLSVGINEKEVDSMVEDMLIKMTS